MRNPFVGLRPFTSSEDELFFGRAREIAILRDLALTLPVLTVYAPSGTGKSSLINAGLIPAIRRLPGMIDITIADPELDPSGYVRDRLANCGWSPGPELDGMSLAHLLEAHYEDTDRRVILVLDQFEERIKRSEDLDALYADIARLANTRSEAATVIISIREDYLAGLDRLMRRVSGLLDAGYRVPPLSRAALTEAVFRPLSIVAGDVTAEKSLVDAVLTDLEQQAPLAGAPERQIEPGYFQVVWHRLWELDARGPDAVLTQETYAREGGAAAILKSFVGRILSELLPYEAALLQASLRYLVLPTGAKVALTVDDLVGLLRAGDMSTGFAELLFQRTKPDESKYVPDPPPPPEPNAPPRPEVRQILGSLFEQLTRTEAPLFRRVWRGKREEFELMHDLLGVILMEWRDDFELRRLDSIRGMQSLIASPPENIPSITAAAEFIKGLSSEAGAGRWEMVSDAGAAALLHQIIALGNSATWRYHRKSARHFNELVDAFSELENRFQPEAIRNRDREIRRVVQQDVWELGVMRPRRLYYAGSPGVLGWAAIYGFGILASGTSAALAAWVAGLLSFLPKIQYMGLTVGLAAAGAAILYSVAYNESPTTRNPNRPAALNVLFPKPPGPSFFSRATARTLLSAGFWQGREWAWLRGPGYFLFWWPVLFGTFITASYLGAALFSAFSWSPTAGFNVAALFAGPLLAAAYSLLAEVL